VAARRAAHAAGGGLGIPTVLERPNAHTRFAYEVVRAECERIGVALPSGHEHAFNEDVLRKEEAEYQLASSLLCPSDFVARTFSERGFPPGRLSRHQYGFDDETYRPGTRPHSASGGLDMLFVGGCAPRKGLHFALEAWLGSAACGQGKFRIAGAFVPGYAEYLAPMLSHPSVEVLGHRSDVADLMRQSDILVLPSIEEGSALVTSEARGSGCVILVSDAAGAVCEHMHDSLVHRAGDVDTLREQISMLHGDRVMLERLRERSLQGRGSITWDAAGERLLDVYRQTMAKRQPPAEARMGHMRDTVDALPRRA
jgi:glycosyltransferase involved in cell wall biosynthesis